LVDSIRQRRRDAQAIYNQQSKGINPPSPEAIAQADINMGIANALEGMTHDSIWGGKVFMRPQDHQAIQNVHVGVHTDEDMRHPLDNSTFGILGTNTVEMAGAESETTCKMDRP